MILNFKIKIVYLILKMIKLIIITNKMINLNNNILKLKKMIYRSKMLNLKIILELMMMVIIIKFTKLIKKTLFKI